MTQNSTCPLLTIINIHNFEKNYDYWDKLPFPHSLDPKNPQFFKQIVKSRVLHEQPNFNVSMVIRWLETAAGKKNVCSIRQQIETKEKTTLVKILSTNQLKWYKRVNRCIKLFCLWEVSTVWKYGEAITTTSASVQ